jgi:hypothetical protein
VRRSHNGEDCKEDIAVADANEEGVRWRKVNIHSLGNANYNNGFIWQDMDSYHEQT